MLAKRLIGAVIVRDGLAVQSIGYKKWLPIGKPEIVIENLCRWNVDEIAVLYVDRKCVAQIDSQKELLMQY